MGRLTLVAVFCAGYYLGAKAGRERYEAINRVLIELRDSPLAEALTERLLGEAPTFDDPTLEQPAPNWN